MKYINGSLSNFDYVHLILGGDFNTIFDRKMDKPGGDMTHCVICINEYTRELSAFMNTHDFIDAIRFTFPDTNLLPEYKETLQC